MALRTRAWECALMRLGADACRFYDFHPLDHNAIIGYHPQCDNMVHVSGFSGHGVMQSPAVRRRRWSRCCRVVCRLLGVPAPCRSRASVPTLPVAGRAGGRRADSARRV